MKNIWIDGYEANVPQRLGSGQIALNLLLNIERIDQKNNYTILLPSPPLSDMPKEREGFRYKICKPNKLWTRIAVPFALYSAKQKPDLIFSPTHYIPRFSPVKRVGMIFDLAYLMFPEMFKKKDLYQLKNWTKYSIENADHLITISQNSKKDILKYYQIDKDKITVSYPGYESEIYHPIKDPDKIHNITLKYGIGDFPYVVYLGTLQPRKNLIRLIQAMQKIDNLKLVIIGKTKGLGRQAWHFEEILEAPKKYGIEEKIIFTGFIEAKEAALLFNGADAYILPSLYEGFGIPVVDAMACGTPPVVSDVSSLPEVVGNAGLLIDPKSIDQIEQAIRLITTDKKLRAKLSKLSLEQAKKFSWEKTAKEIIKVLENT